VRWGLSSALVCAKGIDLGANRFSSQAIVALWPTHYPYSQYPNVDPRQLIENGATGVDPADRSPPAQINPGRENQSPHSRENSTEISIFGIKPGEWLLSIVTLMLWGATVGLVKSADRTAGRQLRAYFDLRDIIVEDFEVGSTPSVILGFKNVGQTPAVDVLFRMSVGVRDFGNEPEEVDLAVTPDGSKSTVGRDGSLTGRLKMSEPLSQYSFDAVKNDTAALFAWGIIRYSDIFQNSRYFRFRLAFTAKVLAAGEGTMEICKGGNDAT
jgi:hypothetical protein